MKTLPKKGDQIKVWRSRPRPAGERVHPIYEYAGNCASRWNDKNGNPCECRCRGSEYETYDDQMVIEQIMWFMDNSIEAHGYCVSDGEKWHTMLDAPHGDACF